MVRPLACILVICFSIFQSICLGQEFTPLVSQFDRKDFQADNQNWAVTQGCDGVMYFGNGRGLLSFDGILWHNWVIPRNKVVRSVMSDEDRIYVGSFEEFGYFERQTDGCMSYVSLADSLDGYEMQNDEIWKILKFGEKIIFQSFTSYFIFDGESLAAFRSPIVFMFFCCHDGGIYTDTNTQGVSRLDMESGVAVPLSDVPFGSSLIEMLPFDEEHSLAVTHSDGLFLFDGTSFERFETELDAELKYWQVNRAVISPYGDIVLGTILNGAVAIDSNGKKLWDVNTSNVLQSNTVLGMYYDREMNLWLALDTGIALVHCDRAVRYINSLSPSVGSIYAAAYSEPYLYIGTSQGLYDAHLEPDFSSVSDIRLQPQIHGHVWNISKFDSQIICGTNEATYELAGKRAHMICPVEGGMCMARGRIGGRDVLVQGTYTYLCIYEKVGDRWRFSHSLSDFMNPISTLQIDYTGTVWAGHLHQGLYAIRLSDDLSRIDSIERFDSLDGCNSLPVNVYSVNNRVVFTDGTGFYTYDDIGKRIVPYRELNDNLGMFSSAYRVCRFGNDSYWFLTPEEAAFVNFSSGGTRILDVVSYEKFDSRTVDDNQNIIPLSDSKCLFTLENSLAVYTYGIGRDEYMDIPIRFSRVTASDMEMSVDSLLPTESSSIRIPNKLRNLSFTLSYPCYSRINDIRFEYMLEGLDVVWHGPVSDPRIVYNYLPSGHYLLRVKARTHAGKELGEAEYRFDIAPPFYRSTVAVIFYILCGAGFLSLLYYYLRRNARRKNAEIKRIQEERIRLLEREKLESELRIKSKELAATTMNVIRKNEILIRLKDELSQQKAILGSQYPNKYYNKLNSIIEQHLSSEDDWAFFQMNFDRIHENFFRNLQTRYPELTANDMRFCAYFRLNLSSKDIASLMNISLKGVEVARYRIRKKIGLASDKSLTAFMIDFK